MSSLHFYYPDGKSGMVFSYEEAMQIVEEKCGTDLKNYIIDNQKVNIGNEIQKRYDELCVTHNRLYNFCTLLEKYTKRNDKFGKIMLKIYNRLFDLVSDFDYQLGCIDDIINDLLA